MFTYPDINPVALSIGPLEIHWYGIMYIVAFGGAWGLATFRIRKSPSSWTSEQISDLVFFGALGAVIGGRLGSVFFYNFGQWPADIGIFGAAVKSLSRITLQCLVRYRVAEGIEHCPADSIFRGN